LIDSDPSDEDLRLDHAGGNDRVAIAAPILYEFSTALAGRSRNLKMLYLTYW
jgi:hypothetical protein